MKHVTGHGMPFFSMVYIAVVTYVVAVHVERVRNTINGVQNTRVPIERQLETV